MSDTGASQIKPSAKHITAPAYNRSINDPLITPELRTAMRKILRKLAKTFFFAVSTGPSRKKTTKKLLSRIFIVCFGQANIKLKNTLYSIVGYRLTEMSEKGSLKY